MCLREDNLDPNVTTGADERIGPCEIFAGVRDRRFAEMGSERNFTLY